MIAGIVWGIGMALMKETVLDRRTGTIVTDNFADYHVPVNADIPPLDIAFIEEPDYTFNALGARGTGEIGARLVRRPNGFASAGFLRRNMPRWEPCSGFTTKLEANCAAPNADCPP